MSSPLIGSLHSGCVLALVLQAVDSDSEKRRDLPRDVAPSRDKRRPGDKSVNFRPALSQRPVLELRCRLGQFLQAGPRTRAVASLQNNDSVGNAWGIWPRKLQVTGEGWV